MHRKYTDLTYEEILSLFRSGCFKADLDHGDVLNLHTGKPRKVYGGRSKGYRFVKLRYQNKQKTVAVAKVIWMVGNGCLLPPNFEVHHINEDPSDDRFSNLIAVHKNDHDKLHKVRQRIANTDDIPF